MNVMRALSKYKIANNSMKGMRSMYCNNCGKQIDDNAKFCPYCGNNFNSEEVKNTDIKNDTKSSKLWMGIMVAVLVFSIATIGFIIPNIIRNKYIKQADRYIEMKEYDYAVATLKDVPELLKKSNKICSRIKFDDNKTSLMDKNGKCRYVVCEHSKWIYDEKGNLFEVYGEINGEYKPIFETEYMEGGHVLTKINDSINLHREYIEYDSNGNTIKETSYNEDGSVSGSSEYEYDEKENRVKEINYNGDGDIFSEYEYDSEGNMIQNSRYDENGEMDFCHKSEYDENGNEVKTERYEYNKWYLTESGYDSNGNKVKTVEYDENGDKEFYSTYEYNNAGKLLQKIEYDNKGEIFERNEHEYDQSGNLIKRAVYYGNGNLESFDEYNSMGNIIKSVEYDEDGYIDSCIEYEYDNKGNEIKNTEYDGNGNIQSSIEFEYDSKGNEIKNIEYDGNGNLQSGIETEYDDEENIIKDITYDEGSITYYTESEYDSKGNEIKRVVHGDEIEYTLLYDYGQTQRLNNPVASKHKKGFEYVAIYDTEGVCFLSNWYDEDIEQEETEDFE